MTRLSVTQALQKVPLFEDLPAPAIENLALKVISVQLAKDQPLFHQGDPGDSLFIIQSGNVSIVTSGAHGQELVIDRYGPGEIVGELSMIDQEPRSAGVIAAEPTVLLKLPREAFLQALKDHHGLALALLHNLSSRLRFTAAYLQKAIEWAAHIADGDYSAAMAQMEAARTAPGTGSHAGLTRQEEFLAAFIHMVEDVQDREESLKAQLNVFQIHIDEARRQEEVENLLGSRFFQQLEETLEKRKPERGRAADYDPSQSHSEEL